ncbi:unnamed protein product [Somion occarium]|uniref:Uncharacterized protein n=1 Tax=Somion occarium TaxID=3059160 RepID=A0ABP1D1A0_9APHY
MLPIIATLALAFVSFFASAFVILRIVIPILPPHPLSRRVPPSLSPADKSHIWLAVCDILALAIFVWQVITEYLGGPSGYGVVHDPASAVRLWLATTLRQSCLLIVASLTLLHVRLGRPVSFGEKHWMLWGPTAVLAITSTALAGVFAGTNVASFFIGLTAYSTTLAVMSTVAFGCLIGTLIIIKRNLAALNEMRDTWPPVQEAADRPRPSFATEDIDAIKDGSSWITSRASSRHDSISAFSFSTHHTHHSAKPSNGSVRLMPAAMASNPSIPPKSSYWFNPATPYGNGRDSPVPPVPPLPSPYRPSTAPSTGTLHDGVGFHDDDPFRRQAPRMGSQSSWLSEHFSEQATLSAWSFPTTRPGTPAAYPSTPDLHTELLPSTAVSRPLTPAMVSTDVLGGYGYSPEAMHAEKGIAAVNAATGGEVDISVYRAIGWLITVWVPLAFALPYYLMLGPTHPLSSTVSSVLLVLSVTLSSPILALNILLRSPLPIPTGLFDSHSDPPSMVMRAPSPASTLPMFSHEYKRSGSVTVVEGRRSGDVWIANGNAVDGRNKLGRAVGLLSVKPKLSVLPPEGKFLNEELLTPPLPIQMHDNLPSVPHTPQSEISAEMGRHGRPRKDSKPSSYYSGADDSVAFATQIMIAQRHYSTLATTVVLPPSPEHRASSMDVAVSGVEPDAVDPTSRRSSHLRARSISSIAGPPVSPPPASPLPPTPPSIKERKAARLTHRKSYSSGFSFGAIDNTAEIDALSAGVLPLLVPGLKVGSDMKISKEWKVSSPTTMGKSSTVGGRRSRQILPQELGGISTDFSSPEMHSTPAERKEARTRKTSHKRHHFSLPSLSLGKDGIHALSTWRTELNREIDTKLTVTVSESTRRNTLQWEGDVVPGGSGSSHLNVVQEEDEALRPTSPGLYPAPRRPVGSLCPPSDVPENMTSQRNSLNMLITALDQELRMAPPSANSEVTLFDFNPNDGSGPQAESTPHESQRTHTRYSGQHEPAPPVPKLPKSSRRSSIVYIKSDENTAPTVAATTRPSTTPTRLEQLTSRVRPLIPKVRSNKLQAKTSTSPTSSENSPGGGLRPLSLLQNREVNQGVGLSKVETRPLTPGKKKRGSKKTVVDENAPESDPNLKKSLKPLKLSRSETTKQRAILRAREVIPDVVVRPPSQYTEYTYGF